MSDETDHLGRQLLASVEPARLFVVRPFMCILLGLAIFLDTPVRGAIYLWGLAVLPLLFALHRFLIIKCRHYQITTERMRIRRGFFQRTDEVELYRVRIMSSGAIHLTFFWLSDLLCRQTTSVNPSVTLQAIPGWPATQGSDSEKMSNLRDKKRVRVTEWEGDHVPPQ